jgi:hypothetical protein
MIGRIKVCGRAGQKAHKTPSQQRKLGMVVNDCHPSTVESINGRITVHGGLDKKQNPISKITRAKGARGMVYG